MSRRTEKINELLREEISGMVATELRDPRLFSIVSITYVETSADLRYAKVFISVLGADDDKKRSLEALESAAGFLHRELKGRVHLRRMPQLYFKLDESIEKSNRIFKLIKEGIPTEEERD